MVPDSCCLLHGVSFPHTNLFRERACCDLLRRGRCLERGCKRIPWQKYVDWQTREHMAEALGVYVFIPHDLARRGTISSTDGVLGALQHRYAGAFPWFYPTSVTHSRTFITTTRLY